MAFVGATYTEPGYGPGYAGGSSAPSILTGVQNTYTPNQRQFPSEMDKAIALIDEDVAPFTHFTLGMGLAKRQIKSIRYEWMEDEQFPNIVSLSGSSAGTGNSYLANPVTASQLAGDVVLMTLGANEYPIARVYDVLMNTTTNERLLVVSTATGVTNQVALKRGMGLTVGAALAAGYQGATTHILLNTGSAYPQGSAVGDARQVKKVANWGTIQLHRHPFFVTNTLAAVDQIGVGDPAYQKQKELFNHKRSLEFAGLLGLRQEISSVVSQTGAPSYGAGNPLGMTGGVAYYATQNVTAAAGAVTEATLDAWLTRICRYNKNPILLGGPLLATALHRIAVGAGDVTRLQPNVNPVDLKRWGKAQISQYTTITGKSVPVKIIETWGDILNQAGTGAPDAYALAGAAFCLDQSQIGMRTLRATRLEEEIQQPGQDSYGAEFLTEAGFFIKLPRNHGILWGITG